MSSQEQIRRTVRFGAFELDLDAGELRKEGHRLKLQGQPFQVLAILVQRPGEIVSREELHQALWPRDTFVEFDDGLNTAIRKVRQVLGDSTESPRFIETVPRNGYRFIAHVDGLAKPVPVPPPPQAHTRRLVLAGTAVAFTVLMLAGSIWLWRRASIPEPEFVPIPLTSYPGEESWPSLSPDGNQVAFTWGGGSGQSGSDIYVKLIGTDPPVRLTTKGGAYPAWSPDGRFIAFCRLLSLQTVGIFLIPAVGGAERKVAETTGPDWQSDHYVSWYPNGKWLVVPDVNSDGKTFSLYLVSVETGEKRRLTYPTPGVSSDQDPDVAPDGSAVVFVRVVDFSYADVFLQEISGELKPIGEPVQLTSEKVITASPVWMPDGRGIVYSSGVSVHRSRLWKLALSKPGWHPGKPQRLSFAGESSHSAAISRNGRLAYANGPGTEAHIWQLALNEDGSGARAGAPPQRVIASSRLEHLPRYSPDGKRIAFASDRSGDFEIWVCNRDGSGATQLTSLRAYAAWPKWSPDGRQILFQSGLGGKSGSYVISSDGGSSKLLTEESGQHCPNAWSPDGKWIYFESDRAGTMQVWRMPAAGGKPNQVTRTGGFNSLLSPDGAFLYYAKREPGSDYATGLWRVPVAGGEEMRVQDLGGCWDCVNFAVADHGVYFIPCGRDEIRYLNFATGSVKTIWQVEGGLACGLSVSPDGRSLLYTQYGASVGDLMLVENFR